MMIPHLKVRFQSKRVGKFQSRLTAIVVQDTAEGIVEGTDLLKELPPVETTREAKALVWNILRSYVKKVEFI